MARETQTQLERDGPLDRAAGAVTGLADAGELAGVLERDLDVPAGRVALDQVGRGGVQVGGDQREVVAAGGGPFADQDQPDGLAAERPIPQAEHAGQVHGGGVPLAGEGGWLPGGGGVVGHLGPAGRL
jgi:hypothetical protein